jgi:hypothetical protein
MLGLYLQGRERKEAMTQEALPVRIVGRRSGELKWNLKYTITLLPGS